MGGIEIILTIIGIVIAIAVPIYIYIYIKSQGSI